MESIDAHFIRCADELDESDDPSSILAPHEFEDLLRYFDAAALSRHTDLLTRELQSRGEAFYTIGSSGHEANAAIALALEPSDPALLHYRSGGFYSARAAQVPGVSAADDILRGAMSSTADSISGGRHKVFGSVQLNVIPQTSTIASHLPRAFGLAFALGHPSRKTRGSTWPKDAVVVASFGDASVNHSSALGALNAAAYCTHRGIPIPLLFVCEDNGIGISTRSPEGWVRNLLRSVPGIDYYGARGTEPVELLRTARSAVFGVRNQRRPAILHLETVRFMGHAGSDAEIAYRSTREIESEFVQDPLLAAAKVLVGAGAMSSSDIVQRYESAREHVATRASHVPRTYLRSAAQIIKPIVQRRPTDVVDWSHRRSIDRMSVFRSRLPEDDGPQTLAKAINACLMDAMAAHSTTLVFGEDVGRKGGVYGITRGLQKSFGAERVFDTILDEQTILGTALGSALAGFLPIPEIQYLAYLHNAEDQLRGEAATLQFFSNSQYTNGMVVRIAAFAYQKGFGGHFHNDNSVAVLRDIPGLILAVPSHPKSAPGLFRHCIALAQVEGSVCVFLEPIALYHERDLLLDGDEGWLAPYESPQEWASDTSCELGMTRIVRQGHDVLVLTFGNGVRMSLRAADAVAQRDIECTVVDLQWLSPLPSESIQRLASQFSAVLVVDETRRSGSVSESIVTCLVDAGYQGRVKRITSDDCYIPLGPAAQHVLLAEQDIVNAIANLVTSRTTGPFNSLGAR